MFGIFRQWVMAAVVAGFFIAATHAVALAQTSDELGRQINRAFEANKRYLVTVSYSRTVDAGQMGEQDTGGSLTGVLVDASGIVMISGQDFFGTAGISGLARMMGGNSGEPTNFRVRLGSGTEFAADFLGGDKDANVAFVKAKLEDGMTLPAVAFDPIAVAELEVGQQVIMLGTYPDFLNFARKFHLARVNAIIDARAGLIGVDGPADQCVGGVVLSLDGRAIGFIGERTSPQANPASGGIGRLIRGVTSGGEGIRTCILTTPAAFNAHLAAAKKKADELKAQANATPETPAVDPNAELPATLGLSRVFPVSEDTLATLKNFGYDLSGVTGGVLVAGVDENSVFANAGLKRRDMIVEINGASLGGVKTDADMAIFTKALADAIAAAKAGDGSFRMKVWAAGDMREVQVSP